MNFVSVQGVELLARTILDNLFDYDGKVFDQVEAQLFDDQEFGLVFLDQYEGTNAWKLERHLYGSVVDERGLLQGNILVRALDGAILKYGQLF